MPGDPTGNKSNIFLPNSVVCCNQFGTRSGPTKCQQNVRPDLDPNCLTLMVFLKDFFEKVDFEKNQQMAKKHAKLPSRERV